MATTRTGASSFLDQHVLEDLHQDMLHLLHWIFLHRHGKTSYLASKVAIPDQDHQGLLRTWQAHVLQLVGKDFLAVDPWT